MFFFFICCSIFLPCPTVRAHFRVWAAFTAAGAMWMTQITSNKLIKVANVNLLVGNLPSPFLARPSIHAPPCAIVTLLPAPSCHWARFHLCRHRRDVPQTRFQHKYIHLVWCYVQVNSFLPRLVTRHIVVVSPLPEPRRHIRKSGKLYPAWGSVGAQRSRRTVYSDLQQKNLSSDAER